MKLTDLIKPKKKYRYRSAKNGRVVTRAYALLHPFTTIKETIK